MVNPKYLTIKTGLSTRSIVVMKRDDGGWVVDVIAYGDWYSEIFSTLKQAFNYIRSWDYVKQK